jgi:hypothetical protein
MNLMEVEVGRGNCDYDAVPLTLVCTKEENTRLKMNLMEVEAGRGNCDYDAVPLTLVCT